MLCIAGDAASPKHTLPTELHKEACFSIIEVNFFYVGLRPETSSPIELSKADVEEVDLNDCREASMSQVMW